MRNQFQVSGSNVSLNKNVAAINVFKSFCLALLLAITFFPVQSIAQGAIITDISDDAGPLAGPSTSDTTLDLEGIATPGEMVTIYDDSPGGGKITLTTTVAADGFTGAWTYTTPVLTEDDHLFSAEDSFGESFPVGVTIDLTNPLAPVITGFTDDTGTPGDNITSDTTPTLIGTTEPFALIEVLSGTMTVGLAPADPIGGWSLTITTLVDGTYSYTAEATDMAGNTGPASTAQIIIIDTSVPPAPPVTPTITSFSVDSGATGDGVTNDNTLTLTGTAGNSVLVEVFEGISSLGTTTSDGSGDWSFTTGVLAEGPNVFVADVSGTVSVTPFPVLIDTAAPAAPVITGFADDSAPTGDLITTDTTLILTGTAEGTATITVLDGVSTLGTATANGAGAWSYTTSVLAGGTHTFTVTATDIADNTGAASTALVVFIDAATPPAPTPTPAPTIKITNVSYGDSEANIFVEADAEVAGEIAFPSFSEAPSFFPGDVVSLGNNAWKVTFLFYPGDTAEAEIYFADPALSSSNVVRRTLSNPIQFKELSTKQLSSLSPTTIGGFSRNDFLDISPEALKAMADCEYSRILTSLLDPTITPADISEYLKEGWSLDPQTYQLVPPEGTEVCVGGRENKNADYLLLDPTLGLGLLGESTYTIQQCIDETLFDAGFTEFSLIPDNEGIFSLLNKNFNVIGFYMPGAPIAAGDAATPGLALNENRHPVITCLDGLQIPFIPFVPGGGQFQTTTSKTGDTTVTFNGNKVTGTFKTLPKSCTLENGVYADGNNLELSNNGMCQTLMPKMGQTNPLKECADGEVLTAGACAKPPTISISGSVTINEAFTAVTITAYNDSKKVKTIEVSNADQGSTASFTLKDLTTGPYTLKARGYEGSGKCNDGSDVPSGNRCDDNLGIDLTISDLDITAEVPSAVISSTTSDVSLNLGEPPLIISGDISVFFPRLELIWMIVSSKNGTRECIFWERYETFVKNSAGEIVDLLSSNINDKTANPGLVDPLVRSLIENEKSCKLIRSSLDATIFPFSLEVPNGIYKIDIKGFGGDNFTEFSKSAEISKTTTDVSLSLGTPSITVSGQVTINGSYDEVLVRATAIDGKVTSTSLENITQGSTQPFSLDLPDTGIAYIINTWGTNGTGIQQKRVESEEINVSAATSTLSLNLGKPPITISGKLTDWMPDLREDKKVTLGVYAEGATKAESSIEIDLLALCDSDYCDTISSSSSRDFIFQSLPNESYSIRADIDGKSTILRENIRESTSTLSLSLGEPLKITGSVTFYESCDYDYGATVLLTYVDTDGKEYHVGSPDTIGNYSKGETTSLDIGLPLPANKDGYWIVRIRCSTLDLFDTIVHVSNSEIIAESANLKLVVGEPPVTDTTSITAVTVSSSPLTSGADATMTVSFKATTALTAGDKIFVKLTGYTLPAGPIDVTAGTGITAGIGARGNSSGEANGALDTLEYTLGTEGGIAAGTTGTFTFPATNPAAGTTAKAGLTVHTSKDTRPVASAADIVITAPLSFSTQPTMASNTETSVTLTFKVSGTGDTACVIALASGASAPTAAQVVAGNATDKQGTPAACAAITGADQTTTVTGLSIGTTYDFYVALDDSGVLSSKVSVSTKAETSVTAVTISASPLTSGADATMTVSFKATTALTAGDKIFVKLTGYTMSAGPVMVTAGTGITAGTGAEGNVALGVTDTLVYTLGTGGQIAAGTSGALTFTVTNPAAGTIAKAGLTVATSKDTVPVASAAEIVIAAATAPTNVRMYASPLFAGAEARITTEFRTTTALTEGDTITVKLTGYTIPPGEIGFDLYKPGIRGSGNSAKLAPGTTDTVVYTFGEGNELPAGEFAALSIWVVNPPIAKTIAKAGLTLHTSKDTTPVASSSDIVITAPLSFTTQPVESSTTKDSVTLTFKASGTGDTVCVAAIATTKPAPTVAEVAENNNANSKGTPAECAETTGADQTLTVTGLESGTVYDFYVALKGSNVLSNKLSQSTKDSFPPGTISGTVEILGSFDQVKVNAIDSGNRVIPSITPDTHEKGSTVSFSFEDVPYETYTITAQGFKVSNAGLSLISESTAVEAIVTQFDGAGNVSLTLDEPKITVSGSVTINETFNEVRIVALDSNDNQFATTTLETITAGTTQDFSLEELTATGTFTIQAQGYKKGVLSGLTLSKSSDAVDVSSDNTEPLKLSLGSVSPDNIVIAQGAGGSELVRIIDSDSKQKISEHTSLSETLRNSIGGGAGRGTFITTGDVNNDGTEDIVHSFGQVKEEAAFPNVFIAIDGDKKTTIGSPRNAFRASRYSVGEIRTAVGDFQTDGENLVAVARGFGSDLGLVRLFKATGETGPLAWSIVGQFQPLDNVPTANNANGGVTITAGDVDGDGKDELVFGQTNSDTSLTQFSVLDIDSTGNLPVRHNFTAFTPGFRGQGGVELAVADLNGDGINEIVATQGGITGTGDTGNVITVIVPILDNNNTITGYARPAGATIQLIGDSSINPSGGLSLAAGELDGDASNGDEIIFGSGSGAPQSFYRTLKLYYDPDEGENGTVTGFTFLIGPPKNTTFVQPAFSGADNPSSGAINVATLPASE